MKLVIMLRVVVLCQFLWLANAFYTKDPRIRGLVLSRSINGRQGGGVSFPKAIDGHSSSRKQTPRTIAKYASFDVVQGSSLQIFSFLQSKNERRLRIDMVTDGRPLEAKAELWQGPHYIPQKVRVYSENGRERPFRVVMETPLERD
eukprot:scaffold26548_cov93-Cylindrotheca_fusiformis.AAC.1